jgi:hypothetical protein
VCLRRSSRINPFVRLPFELIRQVFELAANDRRTVLSLRLVSKEVHRWITPIMFRTVMIARRFHSESCGILGECIINTRLIKNLCFGCQIHNLCSGDYSSLQNLFIYWHHLFTITPRLDIKTPTLTHLTLRGTYNGACLGNHSLLIFRSVTHLYFPLSDSSILSWILPPLPLLTHVVLGFNARNPVRFLLSHYLSLLEPMDTLQMIGIELVMPPPYIDIMAASRMEFHNYLLSIKEKTLSAVRESSFRAKHKTVIMSRDTTFEPPEWNTWFLGGETIWETAERLLSEHEQSQCLAEEGRKGEPAHEP